MPLPKIASDVGLLTDALRRGGVLSEGRIKAATVESLRPTVLSHIIRLRLAYEGAAPGAPETLIVKTRHPDRTDKTWHAGRHEVAFYDKVGAATAGRLVPRCYEAAWEQATNAWHLLLEDLPHRTPLPQSGRYRPAPRSARASSRPGRGFTRPGGMTPGLAPASGSGATAMQRPI